MNNHEAVVATLARHREARQWSDDAVARDLMQQLDLNPTGEASKARLLVDPALITEDEVVAHETAAKVAHQKATEARAKLNGQVADEAKAKADVSADQARAAQARVNAPSDAMQRVKTPQQLADEAMDRERRATELRQSQQGPVGGTEAERAPLPRFVPVIQEPGPVGPAPGHPAS
jgi:hypothetical protein